ncbi:MAG: LpxI family protein [Thermoguttaceae bacterium]
MPPANRTAPCPKLPEACPPRRVGLLAGWGRYPFIVADALRRQGCHAYCLGIRAHADPHLAPLCHDFRWIGLARIGQAIRYFRRHRITEATMAGKIHKGLLFQPWRWLRLLPDWRTLQACIPHLITRRKDCRDDSLLRMVVDQFAAYGIHFKPATDYAPQLLVEPGQLTRRAPSAAQWKDIRFGWTVAKELGRLDIGQCVAVKDQAVLAVEAIEGTDHCIRRAGDLCPAGEFTVIKLAKPQQDMRFDVPTVGLATLRTMVAAGARVLAIEARRTILLDQAAVVDYANQHKLVLLALENPPEP